MSEEVSVPVVSAPAPEVPVVAPISAPVEVAPIIAPVETSVAPVVEAAPVVEPVSESPKPLLSPETPEVKPVDAEVKIEESKTDAEPAPLPVYEFKLPEGAQVDNPIFKSFQSKLGEFQNLSKTEQAAVQKFGQEMLDMHMEDVKAVVESQNKASWDWFKARNTEWLDTAKKDPQIGGDNWDGTVSSASQAITLYGGTKAQQIETAKLLQETGVENHPAILRFLANITRTAAKEGSPVSSQSASVQKPSISQALYGKKLS